MQNHGIPSDFGLEHHGLYNINNAYWNLLPPALIEEVILRREGELSNDGAVVVNTGQHTGRSPNDKFIVKYDTGEADEIWWGDVNIPIHPEKFHQLHQKMVGFFQGRDVFIQDMFAGAHPIHKVAIRIISEKAWHSLAAYNMFIRLLPEQLVNHIPKYTLIDGLNVLADPTLDETKTSTFIVVDFSKKLILVGGSGYAGEIKKSIFTIMNYELPRQGILSMHCSANIGERGDVALFFGLSGTGKTSLSSDVERRLIGDDQHGWADDGVFNFEGGCYAKAIRLRPDWEPLIWDASHRYGAVLENVIYDPYTRVPDFNDNKRTDNIRASYPIHYIDNYVPEGYAGHPENIFLLTADAFGVLPPLAKLTPDQAKYYFLAGYTAKLAGTERGLGKEPQATFSTGFGAPFLPLYPSVYAELLGQKIKKHNVKTWLVNTGWTGGPYGEGERIQIPYTRAMIRAALTHQLDDVPMHQDSLFGLWIPDVCPGVPNEVLVPQKTWKDPSTYEKQARELIALFEQDFKQFEGDVSSEVIAAGPHN